MSADEQRRIRQQQEANAVRLQRLEMQVNSQNARREPPQEEEEQPQFHQPQQPQYNQVDPNQMLLDQITANAANLASQHVINNVSAHQTAEKAVKSRMDRLIADYPAVQQEDSALVIKARDIYQRINTENPSLDPATKYELAIREAASALGARPVTSSADVTHEDFTMSSNSGYNPSRGNPKSGKSRLTQKILQNAMALGINVDAKTPDGKKNLAELDEYSGRFNADADENHFRYK